MNERNLAAKKSLGQNFLKSKKAIAQMIEASGMQPGDLVVEIGPGKGALTRMILDAGAKMRVYELDERMVEYLSGEFADDIASGQLTVIHQDVLEIEPTELQNLGDYRVIANIPYYITNAIVRFFLESVAQPKTMVLLVQKEVAERIAVRDGKQSILALSVSLYGTPRYVAKVDRKYFSPSPKVDSAIIAVLDVNRHNLTDTLTEQQFFDVVKTGLGQKRKMLIKNLQALYEKKDLQETFLKLSIQENIRGEDLTQQLWLQLAAYLKNYSRK